MPRFVLLRHETLNKQHGPSHWDLMLEIQPGGALATWQLETLPENWGRALSNRSYATDPVNDSGSGDCVDARRLADHRRAYLDYEGPISGDRGAVRRCDRGACEVLEAKGGRVRAKLHGERIRGAVELRLADAQESNDEGTLWQLSVADDET